MPDIKRIAVFLDGTWNNVDANTNVWRLKSLCDKSPEQLIYYSAGVGTQSGKSSLAACLALASMMRSPTPKRVYQEWCSKLIRYCSICPQLK